MPKKVVSGNKIKIEVEIPKVYYEGLFANPSVDMDAQTAQIMDEESVEEKADDNTNYGILS